jgi:flagellar protein FlbD
VILVHRLRGEPLFLNADLIECIEATPDTVVTLADGRKYVVGESPDEIVERARQFRASVQVAADELRRSSVGLGDERAHPGPAVP